MYVNGKMRPVETIPGMRGETQRRMMEGVNSTMTFSENVCNVTMYPHYTIIFLKSRKK
jgi:hypothetical protein